MSGLGSVGDLRTAIASEIVPSRVMAEGPNWMREDAFEIADRILAIPGLRQAWERSQAIDAVNERAAGMLDSGVDYYGIDRLRAELQLCRNLLGNAAGAIADTGDLLSDMTPSAAIYELTRQRDAARAALNGHSARLDRAFGPVQEGPQ